MYYGSYSLVRGMVLVEQPLLPSLIAIVSEDIEKKCDVKDFNIDKNKNIEQ